MVGETKVKYVWVPQTERGAFASRSANKYDTIIPLTMNVKNALHFETYEECRDWCLKRKEKFVPQQHGV